MEEMKSLSLIELKALVYDEVSKMETYESIKAECQKKIQELNKQILEMIQKSKEENKI